MMERDSGKAEAPGAVKTEAPGAAKTEALDREKMDAPAKSRILAKLFWSTLYLSAFTFGGGYVIVTLMKKKFVDEYGWIKEDEMLDLVAIAQSSPGAIAVNGAIVIGYKLAGLLGAATAILATVIPPFVVISAVSLFYNAFRENLVIGLMLEGMQAGVGAVIAVVVYEMGSGIVRGKSWTSNLIMAGAFSGLLRLWSQRGAGGDRLRPDRRGTDVSWKKGGAFMIYLQLFLSFLQIGLFSFGGGYAAMPLIQDQVVTAHGWLSMPEFTDLITISQMTPGPIAINSATFVGMKIAGVPGAVAATVGCVFPSCVIVTLLARLYLKYRDMSLLQGILGSLRPAVVAMVAAAGISILITAFWGGDQIGSLESTRWWMVGIFALCVLFLKKLNWNPIAVMLSAGVLRVLLAVFGI